ncbi:restriction endonuclease [Edwardsiella ictaluri]|uniref:Type II restriction endonuclease n=1 Tax=Edwardsiella ictaluri (strain 93-146) TaxID=634503 RepID=C5BFF1_EDWI9|nr:type II restriction endonuclease [Edwardsiella ictaluri]ACR68668.2 type II restriction endonuclease [Edwardsiella ictaluri 93-146]AVZ81048.1 restriction endonuclease [Edwardsiella ictaluri]EKS7764182.1 type II restriction endonuclease [Edwardsiella ictaluri]EKS7771041.1 type II restriction endonuclease [Edwardsiella ictaluri]EKS7774133.1 type II restriction endonuclease [Edwardsiella ictaluri]
MSDLSSWIIDKLTGNAYVYIKRLSANDTGATGAHQVGTYMQHSAAEYLFPSINKTDECNPSLMITARTSSHSYPENQVRVIYYNNKFFGKTRNERRITRWGGGSPLQDTENTGALALLVFDSSLGGKSDCQSVDVWVCRDADEEDIVEASIGEILPGDLIFGLADEVFGGFFAKRTSSHKYTFPDEWKKYFPSGKEIISYASGYYSKHNLSPDTQLLERRKIEYDIFLQVEELHVLSVIKTGFSSVDAFISLANSVSNRRKSRSGKSLELHLENIFYEYGLTEFETQAVTEGNKKPDFLFPSAKAYHDDSWPPQKLRMLAVKTTCKDRWRQILNEADRIQDIYLFTLQEGVSITQFREMQEERVRLVVPEKLHEKYPAEIRGNLISLNDFIFDTKKLYS